MTEANPLLAAGTFPAFDRIRPEHVVPAMHDVLAEAEAALARLEASVAPSVSALLEPYERITDRVGVVWSAVSHLMAVRNSEALREAYEAVQPEVVRFQLRLAQSRPVHGALEALAASPEFSDLGPARQRIVSLLLRDARLAGVGLEGAARERFNAIETELADLATRFGNHLLDATKAFSLVLRDPGEVAGLPESLLGLAAQSAREAGHPEATAERGPWRITLDRACSGPFLEHSRRRELRERVYRASVTRASEGALDNGPILARILDLRREQGALLGFASYAEMSLASKMAPDVAAVERLLEEVRRRAYPAARIDLAELRAFAQQVEAPEAEDLRPWDVPFFAERLREARFAYSEEELRPYFPLPRVLEGLFELARRLFGVRVEPADGEAPIWHPDVRFFRVRDESGANLAAFTLDPYSRPSEKRGGAWMDDCVGRSRLLAPPGATVRLPVAHLVCNQIPPVGERPSLMSFEEVSTLFHEFGHGLQHMLTTVDEGLAAGIRNVEWDAVELPSQFMENWCYHRPTLLGLSRHVETGAPLPDPTFEKIRAARTFRAGSFVLRQIHFGLTDLELHHRFVAGGRETAFDVMRRIGETTTVLPPIPEDRFLCSFSHIFAGGYAAGYYSYLWADVLAADAFAAFEEAGLVDPGALAAAGRRFRETVLALGGSRHPLEVFRSFRGRDPTPAALLRQLGLEQ